MHPAPGCCTFQFILLKICGWYCPCPNQMNGTVGHIDIGMVHLAVAWILERGPFRQGVEFFAEKCIYLTLACCPDDIGPKGPARMGLCHGHREQNYPIHPEQDREPVVFRDDLPAVVRPVAGFITHG